MRPAPRFVCSLLLWALAGQAFAGNVAANLAVGAVIVANCRISVNDLSFGAYDPLGTNAATDLEATTRVSVVCTKNSVATVSLDGGGTLDSGAALRQMSMGDFRLEYQLYRDSEHRLLWGEGDFSERVIGAGSVVEPQILFVYGRIPRGQVVPAGAYADVVTARIDF